MQFQIIRQQVLNKKQLGQHGDIKTPYTKILKSEPSASTNWQFSMTNWQGVDEAPGSYPAGSDEWIGNRCASSLHCHARVMSGYQGTQQSTHQTLEWILSIEGLRYSNSVSFLPLPLYSICSDRSNLILPRHSFTQLIVLQWFLRVLVQIESKWVESCFRKAHYVFRCFEMTC